jgi:hypothetical protein
LLLGDTGPNNRELSPATWVPLADDLIILMEVIEMMDLN